MKQEIEDRDGDGPEHLGARLGRLFSGHTTEKTYWAVVQGAPPAEEGVFDKNLLKLNSKTGRLVDHQDQPVAMKHASLDFLGRERRRPLHSWGQRDSQSSDASYRAAARNTEASSRN